MQDDLGHLKRMLNLRVKYALEKAHGQVLDASGLQVVAQGIRQGEDAAVIKSQMEKLAREGVDRAQTVLKELVAELVQEHLKAITEIISETVTEMVTAEIEKATRR